MNRLTVTVIDILGILVPGAALLLGLLLLPIPGLEQAAVNTALVHRLPLFSNLWVAGACWLAVAYVLGFLVRLVSIRVMNVLTWRTWSSKLADESKALEPAFEHMISNPPVSLCLRNLADLCGRRDPGRYAPFFHFSKRLIRGAPDYWSEAEHLEAEVRFASGMFIPFVVIFIDGMSRGLVTAVSWLLTVCGGVAALLVVVTFPSRRVKECLYDQLLALALLLNGTKDKARPEAVGVAHAQVKPVTPEVSPATIVAEAKLHV